MFNQDIDNFFSINPIRNYIFYSLEDENYDLGKRSVGVLLLYNKERNGSVSLQDQMRIQMVSKLIAGLSMKCLYIFSNIQTLLGLLK